MAFLQTLQLKHFKNHKQSDFEFAEKLNCFVGDNGMGKTNVLDAIFFTCLTKSYSGLSDAALIQHDADFFRIDADFYNALQATADEEDDASVQTTAPPRLIHDSAHTPRRGGAIVSTENHDKYDASVQTTALPRLIHDASVQTTAPPRLIHDSAHTPRRGGAIVSTENHDKYDDTVQTTALPRLTHTLITIKQPQKKRKTIENNGRIYERVTEHIGRYTVVMLSPDDPYTLMDGSEERRRFIDTAIAQTNAAYLQQLSLYNKILEQRNALLKAALQQKMSPNAALLEVYDAQLVAPANFVFEQRKVWLAQFSPIFQTYYAAIAQANETVECRYESGLLTQDISTILAQNYQRDCVLGRTTGGIHKDDIQLIINDLQLKKYASQGQLKSYTLALKLAQAEYIRASTQQAPILLLDDIFDKLDHQRVLHLLALLHQPNFGQLFITDTDKARILRLTAEFGSDFRVFEVKNGSLV